MLSSYNNLKPSHKRLVNKIINTELDEKLQKKIRRLISKNTSSTTKPRSNGWLEYYKEHYYSSKKTSQGTITDLAKELSEKWRKLSAEEKQIYTDRAKKVNAGK